MFNENKVGKHSQNFICQLATYDAETRTKISKNKQYVLKNAKICGYKLGDDKRSEEIQLDCNIKNANKAMERPRHTNE